MLSRFIPAQASVAILARGFATSQPALPFRVLGVAQVNVGVQDKKRLQHLYQVLWSEIPELQLRCADTSLTQDLLGLGRAPVDPDTSAKTNAELDFLAVP